jgi:hypothetical protein
METCSPADTTILLLPSLMQTKLSSAYWLPTQQVLPKLSKIFNNFTASLFHRASRGVGIKLVTGISEI